MKLATLEGHNPSCSGCPACSPDMLKVLSMNDEEHAAWLKDRRTTGRVLRQTDRGPAVPPPPDFVTRVREAFHRR